MTTLIFLIVGCVIITTSLYTYLTAVNVWQGVAGIMLFITGITAIIGGLLLPLI